MRKIIHIDMDAFYAAVEQRDQPELRGRPVIVGGNPVRRGVVAACSYEARQFGIHSAMAAAIAQRRCPEAIFVRPRFPHYRRISAQVREIFERYTQVIEPLALDEAYMDVTHAKSCGGIAVEIARAIKHAIHTELQLTASAGISINKFLAKLACEYGKPDGLYLIRPAQAERFVANLDIAQFPGVGKVTARRMRSLGINTGTDLRTWSLTALLQEFGRVGRRFYELARAQDARPVLTSQLRKSLSFEQTFAVDVYEVAELRCKLIELVHQLSGALQQRGLYARTLTLKVKYADFRLITRSQSVDFPLQGSEPLEGLALDLLGRTAVGQRAIRLLGIGVSNFIPLDSAQPQQLGLFRGS